VATTDTTAWGDIAFAPTQLADGRIVTAIRNASDGAMIGFRRFLANGSPDTDFGNTAPVKDGRLLITPTPAFAAYALQGDRIIMATQTGSNVYLTRYDANGDLDNLFGTQQVSNDMSGPIRMTVQTDQMDVQADGKIVVVGGTASGLALVRRNADGTADTSFGATGEVDWALPYQQPAALAVQPDNGKILVGDSSVLKPDGSAVFAVMRFNSDGSLDTGFGADPAHPGVARRVSILVYNDAEGGSDPGSLSGLGLDDAGRIVVSGTGGIIHLTSTGELDHTFGPLLDGVLVFRGNDSYHVDQSGPFFAQSPSGADILAAAGLVEFVGPSGLAVQPDGKILVGGAGASVVRLNDNGSPDTGFGPQLNGIVSVNGLFGASGIVFQSGGRATLIGNSNNFIWLARFTTAPPADHIVNGQVFSIGARATDPGPDDMAAGFTYSIDWGDDSDPDGDGIVGQKVCPTVGNGDGVSQSHQYPTVAVEKQYRVQVTATDQGGLSSQPSWFFVTVDPLTTASLQNVLAGSLPIDPVSGLPAATFTVSTAAEANNIVSQIPSQATPASQVAVVLNGTGVNAQDIIADYPSRVTVVLNGFILSGGSPALTLLSGNLIITNSTFVNATNAPTILVAGGHLTLRNNVIQESTGYSQAAIQITGGIVDLGTGASPGGNTIVINGAGELIHNGRANPVSAIGDTFQINGTALTSPYRIEDAVFHALDSGGGGLVTWVAGNVYVTQSSGSVQRGVTAVVAGGTVNVEAGSYAAYTVGGKPLTVALQGGPTLSQRADELNPGRTKLVVTGTSGNDSIGFNPNSNTGLIDAAVNNLPTGTFAPTGRLVAYGLGGDDNLQVAGSIKLPAWLYGGDGNDRLNGGNGPNVLLGGNGNDVLLGGTNRDVMIGGAGADQLVGNGGDDLMIGGTTAFDDNDVALKLIRAEWTSSHDFASRIANLSGNAAASGFANRLNGDYFLVPLQTLFADGAVDSLTGSSGSDWYIVDASDLTNGANNNDQVTRIGP
jgi:uncharacterized delta-60 repeat protein